jgi:hypothetical protein
MAERATELGAVFYSPKSLDFEDFHFLTRVKLAAQLKIFNKIIYLRKLMFKN